MFASENTADYYVAAEMTMTNTCVRLTERASLMRVGSKTL